MNTERREGMWRPAFSLLELVVTVGVIALLAGLLMPGLSAARQQARAVVCGSNIQQILRANGYYADENNGIYCPGASEFLANRDRWHGKRDRANEPFDSSRGPLVRFLGLDGAVRQCPQFPADEIARQSGGFERGNGGYGYNNAFIGSQVRRQANGAYRVTTDRAGALATRVRRPADTVMFTDSAFAATVLIEYSFAEPRFHPQFPGFRADPSIQFRHRGQANVGWCDGHVGSQARSFTWSSGLYLADPARFDIGWFGRRDDNSLFELD